MCNESMEEKFNGIWISLAENTHLSIVFEEYISTQDKIHVVYQTRDGFYLPYLYIKTDSHQWRLPILSQEKDKTVMPYLESAKNYFASFSENYT